MSRPETPGRSLSLRVVAFAAFAPILVRLPLARLERVLEPRAPHSGPTDEEIRLLGDRIDAILAHSPRLVRRGCLTRGVTQYYFLRRAGADVQLAFGMGKPDDRFAGHCWLVKDGEPFLEGKDPRELFSQMYVIRAGAERAAA